MSELLQVAADWHVRLRSDVAGPNDRAEFDAWLQGDPARRLAYAEVAAAAFACEQIELNTDAAISTGVATRAAPAGRPRAWRWTGALVASLVLGLGLLKGERWTTDLRADWITSSGEVRRTLLPDGSELWLGADSAARFHGDADTRVLELLRGEVFVAIRADPARPFRVQSDAVSARAIGTRYAVARLDALTEVDVEEGVVEVEAEGVSPPRRVHAGERARARAGQMQVEGSTKDTTASWRAGLLVFEALPLKAAVARIERYLPQRVLLLAGARSEVPVTALIPADQAERGLEALVQQQGLRLHRLPGLLVIRQ